MKLRESLYAARGQILAIMALVLLALPPTNETISVSGLLLVAVGITLRISARRNIGGHSRGKTLEAPRLVTEGVYSKIRHPLYLSNGLVASGFILLHLGWTPLALALAAALWLFILTLAEGEDRFLRREFGSTWETWASATPSMIPKAGRADGHFLRSAPEAFLADRWTWVFLLLYAGLLALRRFLP